MTSYGDQLRAATQEGGRPDGWPEDVWSLVMWAAIGCGSWPDDVPEAEAEMARRLPDGDPGVALEAWAYDLVGQPIDLILAAAWAGRARHATAKRDEAIRALPITERGEAKRPGDMSLRQVSSRIGLTAAGVAKIRDRAPD